jgi:probable phosphoglycerate mutase
VPTTTLVLARHGETDWNAVGRWQGHADPPLNDVGRAQAATLAAQLATTRFDAAYSSDLQRARETAAIVADRLGLDVTERADLREIDVGSWSGLTRAEVAARFPEGYARWLGGTIGHDGETSEQLTERVVGALLRVAAAHPGGTVLVVTHGGAIRAARRHATGAPGEPLPNCATETLLVHDGRLLGGAR